MTATRTDISPPLSRIAIAIADYLIPLTADQRDDVIVRAMCLVDDPKDRQIPYRVTDPQPVSAGDDVPHEDPAPVRPTRARVSATRAAASSEIEAAARSIVEVLSGHKEGMTKGALAAALNFDPLSRRFVAALHHVVNAGRIRATGVTNARRYFPATKGA